MKAKIFLLAIAAGLAWMASSLAQTGHNAAADSNRMSPSDSAQSALNAPSSTWSNSSGGMGRRNGHSMMNGMGMMDGMKDMMSSMMNGGMMSGGMDGCPMMGGSRPNNQWRDGGSAR